MATLKVMQSFKQSVIILRQGRWYNGLTKQETILGIYSSIRFKLYTTSHSLSRALLNLFISFHTKHDLKRLKRLERSFLDSYKTKLLDPNPAWYLKQKRQQYQTIKKARLQLSSLALFYLK